MQHQKPTSIIRTHKINTCQAVGEFEGAEIERYSELQEILQEDSRYGPGQFE